MVRWLSGVETSVPCRHQPLPELELKTYNERMQLAQGRKIRCAGFGVGA